MTVDDFFVRGTNGFTEKPSTQVRLDGEKN